MPGRGVGLLRDGLCFGRLPSASVSPPDGERSQWGCEALWEGWSPRSACWPHCPHSALFPFRLKPFTSYKFRVKATNDIGDSEYSEESESLTTLQAGRCP